ncbi:MAG TPA: hypothetical protein VJ227_03535 [Patescibacteria group bacterium]|nr:hypothetical protein [Patescibacteria group bacterium]
MNKRHKTRVALVLLISGGLLIVPYIVRNIILSGWPLYPIPIFGVDVPWTVAESQVRSLSSVIHAWAINPGPSWSKYIEVDFLEWVPVWFARNSGNWDVRIFFAGCLLLLLSPLAGVYKKMSPAFKKPLFLLTAASLINVFYVLFTAPDTRFGAIFIWMFFSAAVTPYAIFLISKGRSFRSYIIAAWLILLIVISYPIIFKNTYSIWTVPKESSRPTTEVQVKGSGVKDQFYILKPTQGNLCGNSGFMCTPESNEIRELVPGEIAKGFGPVN